jgi:CheY-like chemotaxis protein
MKLFHIFYADDDEDDLMLFNEAIEKITSESKNNINLHLHKNGENLIENIKNNKDAKGLVFLDINMPLKSGFQLLEEIRKEPEIQQFPVIMYSTSSNKDFIDKSQHLGADFYVIKPYEFSKLLEMISSILKMNWKDGYKGGDFLYK